jgi:hypothetical protein
MKNEVRRITTALNEASVRYVAVGGLAVVAHGYVRATMDVDLVIDLDRDNLVNALGALEKIGFRPRLPVSKEQFADPETRERWIKEKGMVVFPLWNPDAPTLIIDIFVKSPFDFDAEYKKAVWMHLDDDLEIPFVARDSLIRMKQEAGRPKDMDDIEHLKRGTE